MCNLLRFSEGEIRRKKSNAGAKADRRGTNKWQRGRGVVFFHNKP